LLEEVLNSSEGVNTSQLMDVCALFVEFVFPLYKLDFLLKDAFICITHLKHWTVYETYLLVKVLITQFLQDKQSLENFNEVLLLIRAGIVRPKTQLYLKLPKRTFSTLLRKGIASDILRILDKYDVKKDKSQDALLMN
jgi:hypothetical protein